MSKLTDKQRRFCEEYMKDSNAAQAAIRAGYSEATAKEIGYENLTKLHVKGYLDALRADLLEENEKEVREIIQLVETIARDEAEKSTDRLKAADMLLKVHGQYERHNIQKTPNPYAGMSQTDLDGEIERLSKIIQETNGFSQQDAHA